MFLGKPIDGKGVDEKTLIESRLIFSSAKRRFVTKTKLNNFITNFINTLTF
jgi:hypothetical protein